MSEWQIEIADSLSVKSLEESFFQGPILDDAGRRLFTEAEIDRIRGLKIEIFANEHPPPHFRVSYQGKTANYRISDCTQINGELREFRRNVKKWHAENKQLLIDSWNRFRPTNCPVGMYKE